jgi:hypothetical protein
MIRPVTTAENMTIKRRTTGFGLKRPGGGVAASCFEGDFDQIFQRGGGGRIEVAIWDGAGELDRTTWSPTSMTPQSTSIRGGGGWNGRDMASRLLFYEGFLSIFSAGWGLRHSDFETRWPNAIEPPGPIQQQHNNQTMDERDGAQVARGDCMGGHSDLPFLPCCYYAKKRVVLVVAVVSLG